MLAFVLLPVVSILLSASSALAQGTTVSLDNTSFSGSGQTIYLSTLTASAAPTSATSTGGVGPAITAGPLGVAGMVGLGLIVGNLL
ncbi:hypothetical protein EDD37DRAFT_503506 [Exophiala viscosa]|uniref:uncharacterized protein n=1 Tax=Exophiala viscosa TaxID=2486360 RepID=UPI00219C849E|nr:hypothetical protein EDD37DRAFT_503506 [Exophiala viscosa]